MIYIYIHIYIYIYISTTTNCHYIAFHGLNPIFRWLYNTIFIRSKKEIHESRLQCITHFKSYALFNQLSYSFRMKTLL